MKKRVSLRSIFPLLVITLTLTAVSCEKPIVPPVCPGDPSCPNPDPVCPGDPSCNDGSDKTREEVFDELYEELSSEHIYKRSYSEWKWLDLLDRDWELSPVNPLLDIPEEGKWQTTNIWMRPLYTASPIFITTGVNSGQQYKYIDSDDVERTGNFGGGVQFDREHVFPKSFGFNDNEGYAGYKAGTDLHNLHMGESRNNQNGHNNYFFGDVPNKNTSTKITDAFTSTITGWTGSRNGKNVYEPKAEDKGDIARTIFYMAVRYYKFDETTSRTEPALTLTNDTAKYVSATQSTISSKNAPIAYGYLDDLLRWNAEDPVDDFEIRRNELVKIVQGNRNPFVEDDTLAEFLFGK